MITRDNVIWKNGMQLFKARIGSAGSLHPDAVKKTDDPARMIGESYASAENALNESKRMTEEVIRIYQAALAEIDADLIAVRGGVIPHA